MAKKSKQDSETSVLKKIFGKDTEENRLKDVAKDYKIIKYMDDPSENVIKEAIKNGGYRAIECIGRDNVTPELYKFLIERFPSSFGSLPDEVRTPELCSLAVSLMGTNLRYVTNKTQELCSVAMRKSTNSFQYVPTEFRNEEIYYLAVKNGAVNLRDIPANRRSKRMCLTSVKHQSSTIVDVPDRYKTTEFYTEVFEHNINIFQYLPNELKTEDVCIRVLTNDCRFIEYIPKELQTDKICMTILTSPYKHDYKRYITSESPVVLKKMKKLEERGKRMDKMMYRGFGKHHDFWGMPPIDMIMEPVLDYVYECEDKIDDLTDMVENLKKEMDEMKKLIPKPTEAHEG